MNGRRGVGVAWPSVHSGPRLSRRADRPARQLRRPRVRRDEDRARRARERLRRRRVREAPRHSRPGRRRDRDRARRRRAAARAPGRWRLPADRRAVAGGRRAGALRPGQRRAQRQAHVAARGALGTPERRQLGAVQPRAARRHARDATAFSIGARPRREGLHRHAQPAAGPQRRHDRGHLPVCATRVPGGRDRGRLRDGTGAARRRPRHVPSPPTAAARRRAAAAGARGPAVAGEVAAPGRRDRGRAASTRRTPADWTCTATARTPTSSARWRGRRR